MAAGRVRCADLAPLQQRRQMSRALAICPGCGRAACESARRTPAECRAAHPAIIAQATSAISASLSAVQQRQRSPSASIACVPLTSEMPFFGMQRRRGSTRRAAAPRRRHPRALELRLAFADQHQRHVGQRSQIAARPDAAPRRHHRRDAAIQQIAQPLAPPPAGCPKRPSPARSRGSASSRAPPSRRQRLAHAAGVRAHDVALQLFEIVRRNARIGQQSDARVDGVHGVSPAASRSTTARERASAPVRRERSPPARHPRATRAPLRAVNAVAGQCHHTTGYPSGFDGTSSLSRHGARRRLHRHRRLPAVCCSTTCAACTTSERSSAPPMPSGSRAGALRHHRRTRRKNADPQDRTRRGGHGSLGAPRGRVSPPLRRLRERGFEIGRHRNQPPLSRPVRLAAALPRLRRLRPRNRRHPPGSARDVRHPRPHPDAGT